MPPPPTCTKSQTQRRGIALPRKGTHKPDQTMLSSRSSWVPLWMVTHSHLHSSTSCFLLPSLLSRCCCPTFLFRLKHPVSNQNLTPGLYFQTVLQAHLWLQEIPFIHGVSSLPHTLELPCLAFLLPPPPLTCTHFREPILTYIHIYFFLTRMTQMSTMFQLRSPSHSADTAWCYLLSFPYPSHPRGLAIPD